VKIEYRWADAQYDRLPALAADLAHHPVAAIVTTGVASGLAAKEATSTIPHVFLAQQDPVKLGFVASLKRPGGNATGVALLTSVLVTKRLQLVRELVPTATVIAVLANPNSPESGAQLSDVEVAARSLGQQIHIVDAASEGDFDTAFATLSRQQFGALVVTTDALFYSRHYRIVALATRHAIPTIYDRREFAIAGGLMTYGANYPDAYRLRPGHGRLSGRTCCRRHGESDRQHLPEWAGGWRRRHHQCYLGYSANCASPARPLWGHRD
jgi:putative ABC transport system substrate-binding protein